MTKENGSITKDDFICQLFWIRIKNTKYKLLFINLKCQNNTERKEDLT